MRGFAPLIERRAGPTYTRALRATGQNVGLKSPDVYTRTYCDRDRKTRKSAGDLASEFRSENGLAGDGISTIWPDAQQLAAPSPCKPCRRLQDASWRGNLRRAFLIDLAGFYGPLTRRAHLYKPMPVRSNCPLHTFVCSSVGRRPAKPGRHRPSRHGQAVRRERRPSRAAKPGPEPRTAQRAWRGPTP